MTGARLLVVVELDVKGTQHMISRLAVTVN
jgi:hypothetical protein